MDYSFSGILQARILELVAFPFSRGLPNPGTEPRSPSLQVDSLPAQPPGKPFVYTYHIVFIHSSVDGQLGCIYVLTIVSSAVVNLRGMSVFELWFSLGICLAVGLMCHMEVLFLIFIFFNSLTLKVFNQHSMKISVNMCYSINSSSLIVLK